MRCEDHPACGHDDGLPCDWVAPDYRAMIGTPEERFLHEPGSPEWYDALDRWNDDDEECEHEEYTREQAVNDSRLWVWECTDCGATTSEAELEIEDFQSWLYPVWR